MEKRLFFLYMSLLFFAMLLILRVYYLAFSEDLTKAATQQSAYTVEVCETRGGIFDRKGRRLTEQEYSIYASVSPSVEAMEAVAEQVEGSQRTALLEQLREGKPFLCNLGQQRIFSEGIHCFSVYSRYGSHPLAPHILGYLNQEGKGVSGIESLFEKDLAAAGETVTVRYGVDIQQRPLEAVEAQINGSSEPVQAGAVLTLDRDIQRIAQTVGEQMLDKGAIVVMDVNSGAVLASVSMPSFSPTEVADSLENPDSPLFNRAFAAYNVGSTFKLVVAAAALEQGISTEQTVICQGGTLVNGRMMYCHHRAGHGETDMARALEQSCNPYFIELGQELGGDSILTMAQWMGFGSASQWAGYSTATGNLPSSCDSSLALANLSFGQGELLATPLQIAAMISTIANGGYGVEPTLLIGWTEDGTVPVIEEQAKRQILSQKTARTLQQFMIQVVEKGSGTNAQPLYGGAGGKTASAQTGRMDGQGEEIVHAWFAGFYPAQTPRYAIVVLAEGMESGGSFAAPLFRRICDNLWRMEQDEA